MSTAFSNSPRSSEPDVHLTGAAAIHPASDLSLYARSFRLHLRAENKSELTVITYLRAVDQLIAYLDSRGSVPAAHIERRHVEEYLVSLRDRGQKPATIAQRFRSLQQFFKWLAEEGEVASSPMASMSPPRVPETPPPVLTDEQLRRLLAMCGGTGFEARRDTAIVRLLVDTGMRRMELAGLKLEDIDLDAQVAFVLGKGGRLRACPFGNKTAKAVDRYLRARIKHPEGTSQWLWLGRRGRFTDTGVMQMIRRRGAQAGMPRLHPHLFRHTYAHHMLSKGMQEGDLMRLAGWKSRSMLNRYGASAADERARAAYRGLSHSDDL